MVVPGDGPGFLGRLQVLADDPFDLGEAVPGEREEVPEEAAHPGVGDPVVDPGVLPAGLHEARDPERRGPGAGAARGQATVRSSRGAWFSRCAPSGVTVTMSSIRTPNSPGR